MTHKLFCLIFNLIYFPTKTKNLGSNSKKLKTFFFNCKNYENERVVWAELVLDVGPLLHSLPPYLVKLLFYFSIVLDTLIYVFC